ncbi:hypothetical protein B0T19DRAFT_414014 [Cercophora scortea]|uniref:Uncharacterized protein n=1 Tax=Cercophora scortea TaxID=314031 RepID=A0AAE0IVP2_9PEZI|nr:hypothetical protein B0T19DRAFT_414014 [Cercophora scortea]
MIYLHKRGRPDRPKLALSEIQLYIIDTGFFHEGVFLRDLELIEEFRASNRNLDNFAVNLRARTRETHGDNTSYYYGEYLSQGALNIQGTCEMVTADDIITQDLFILRPEFRQSMNGGSDGPGSRLASEVNRLRGSFSDHMRLRRDDPGWNPELASPWEIRAARTIAIRFGSGWRIPVAAHLLALQPRGDGDEAILSLLCGAPFTYNERERLVIGKTPVAAAVDDLLPEVQQANAILRAVIADFTIGHIQERAQNARNTLGFAALLVMELMEGCEQYQDTVSPGSVWKLAEEDAALEHFNIDLDVAVERLQRRLQRTTRQGGA